MLQTLATLFLQGLIRLTGFVLVSFSPSLQAAAFADAAGEDPESWFEEEPLEAVPQVGEGELVFLQQIPQGGVLHSENRITISDASLASGWVDIAQCYRGLDAIARTEILYRYRNMRDLRIDSYRNMGSAGVENDRVQLQDVGERASLCVRARAQILYTRPDGHRVLRNGPFHRRFLDGFFPMRVTLEVTYPGQSLRLAGTQPPHQPGFEVASGAGQIDIDALFAGSLTVEITFVPRDSP